MKQKQLVAIAVACGAACALCVALFMASVQGEAEAARTEALARYGGEQVEVCVATRDVVAGERLDLSSIETRLWVADLLPEGALRSPSDAVGKTATSPIFKGEVIVGARFESGHDSLEVPLGKQAVSVPAKAVQAVGGAIHPGMSVDIYSSGDTSTVALARDVSVLDTSVGKSGSLTSSENGWITLAVAPEEVQELIAASSKTTLYFTLPGAQIDNGDKASEPKEDAAEGKASRAEREADGGEGGGDARAGSEASAQTSGEAASKESASKEQVSSTVAAKKGSSSASPKNEEGGRS